MDGLTMIGIFAGLTIMFSGGLLYAIKKVAEREFEKYVEEDDL